jgi:succinate dehydrogenase / fumarate reductase cytochrome b subunit
MNKLQRLFGSSLGKKYIMAITGLLLFVFVIGHLAGNLQIFLGREAINDYAEWLKEHPSLLWTVRVGLLVVVILHIVSAIQLVLANRRARPEAYGEYKPVGSNFAAQTNVFSGVVILAFIIYHLLHFTIGGVDPELLGLRDPNNRARHDVYGMMIQGFSNPGASVFYIISMGLLCLHLSHGASSLFQSLGLRRRKWATFIDRFARTAAVLIFIGNCSIPIAILLGWLK